MNMINASQLTLGSLHLEPNIDRFNQLKGGQDGKEIQEVGEQFESLFYSMLLKELRQSIGADGEGGLFPGDPSDTLGGMFDMFMSQYLASSQRLGIGEAVTQYLTNQEKNLSSTFVQAYENNQKDF